MTCIFCGKPCSDSNQLITKHGEIHIGCLLTAYDAARAVAAAQAANLESLRLVIRQVNDRIMANIWNLPPEYSARTVIMNEIGTLRRAALKGVEPEQKAEGERQ